MSAVLVVNTGSSTLKYQLLDPATGERLAKGTADRIGAPDATLTHLRGDAEPIVTRGELPGHEVALLHMLAAFGTHGPPLDDLSAIGHRIVHGGSRFVEPVVVDDRVQGELAALVALAPLHTPAGLLGLRILRTLLPKIPQVAVFDTAFHATMPPRATTYALPRELAERLQIRRYGFHGTSYHYVTRVAARLLDVAVDEVDLVLCHLGNGASVCAVEGGRSIDTSMGMTPLEGLVMGTRSGDLDPAIVLHLLRTGEFDVDELDALLNERSGLRGLCGESDVREVRRRASHGDGPAALALEVYAYRLRKQIAAYLGVLPGARAVVFTGGVGENDAVLRATVCDALSHLGLRLDPALNSAPDDADRFIDSGQGGVRILVVHTDEEAEIAAQTEAVVSRQVSQVGRSR